MTSKPLRPKDSDPLRAAAIDALGQIADPIAELMFETGVTVREFTQLVREIAVRTAAKRVVKESGRDSDSRVAIMTGLSRSEVARILKCVNHRSVARTRENPGRKVLAAWYDDSKFLDQDGEPAILPIFGARRSFERLVALHAKGIPVRAMLDELTNSDSVEKLPNQTVRAKSRIPILTGLTSKAIATIGDQTRDLLKTLSYNLRPASTPFFEGTASIDGLDLEGVPLVRREIEEQSTSFINSANAILRRRGLTGQFGSSGKPRAKCRLGVSVYYFQTEEQGESESVEGKPIRRKNLRRRAISAIRKPTLEA